MAKAQKNSSSRRRLTENPVFSDLLGSEIRMSKARAWCEPIESKTLYLSGDERYEVWTIKAAERPHLLDVCSTDSNHQQENTNEDAADMNEILALTDGCDVSGWRKEKFVRTNAEVLSAFNVGSGCVLLRRETQLPIVLSSIASSAWDSLRDRLFQEPCTTASRQLYSSNRALHPWFERENVPVILDGCPAIDKWAAMKSCRFDNLVQRYGDLEWRFSDTHGETITLKTYQKYLRSIEGSTDDAPLAVYDSQFGGDDRSSLLDDYTVPSCFDSDLFASAIPNEDDRPPFRWLLIGPARSGTGLHIDPVGTHAWVTLIEGCKRWILFPAGTDPEAIHMRDPQIPSAIWFRDFYDQAMRDHADAVEVLQRPGETVFVPAGWPHLVLNLELSVAITHNFATEYPSLFLLNKAIAQAEPELAGRFEIALKSSRPDLFSIVGFPQVNHELSFETIDHACTVQH